MCDLEMPRVFEETRKKARKRHRCCECGGFIEPGETYEHASGLWDGEWATYKTCGECAALRKNLNGEFPDPCDRPAFGLLGECASESDDEYRIRWRRIYAAAHADRFIACEGVVRRIAMRLGLKAGEEPEKVIAEFYKRLK